MTENNVNDVVSIGGSTYDIIALSLGSVNLHDSNPSNISVGCGGVGRNIAENTARLGISTSLISAFGTDVFSDALIASCKSVGIDYHKSYIKTDSNACMYLGFLDTKGELLLAAADVSLIETFPDSAFKDAADYINKHRIVCLDANLNENQLLMIAQQCTQTLIGDTVSIVKAPRFRKILPYLHAVKTNKGELSAITNREINDRQSIKDAGQILLHDGVKQVYITLGQAGACCVEAEKTTWIDGFPTEVCSVSGVGDAFCAAIAFGILHGLSTPEVLLRGSAMSHITLKSMNTVSPLMSEETVQKILKQLNQQCVYE
ncbi:carbohydrate kinase [Clostridia bacterium]|nr:carbohydrate kinase [Clostridia bacterium]